MREKQKEVLERLCKVIEPLNDKQLDDFLNIGTGMVLMQEIMHKKTKTEGKEAG